MNTDLSNISTFGWVVLLVVALALIAAVFVIISRLTKNSNISTPVFSTSEKIQVQAESRELSDNQMRGASSLLGSLAVLFRKKADSLFSDATPLENAYLDLLFKAIVSDLMEQYRIDLVRNHIVKKSDSELKEYTEAKANIYYMRVQGALSTNNDKVSRFDLLKILDEIPESDFFNLYFKAYKNAKLLSCGY